MGMTFTDIENKSAQTPNWYCCSHFSASSCCLYSDVRFSKQYSKTSRKTCGITNYSGSLSHLLHQAGRAETKGKPPEPPKWSEKLPRFLSHQKK